MNIDQIKKEIIKKLGIEALPSKDQERIIDQINEAIISRIIYKTTQKLSKEGLEKFEIVIKDNSFDANELYAFLKKNIENYDIFLEDTINEFFKDLERYEQEDGLKTNPEYKG